MTTTGRWRLVALLAVGATVVAGAVAPTSTLSAGLFFSVALFALVIPLHELGHAAAGALVGYRIMGIVVGTGSTTSGCSWSAAAPTTTLPAS